MLENNRNTAGNEDTTSLSLAEKIRVKQKTGEIPHIARLGDILTLAGLVTKEYIKNALKSQETEKKKKVTKLPFAHLSKELKKLIKPN